MRGDEPIVGRRKGLCAPVERRRSYGCCAIWNRAGHEACRGWRNLRRTAAKTVQHKPMVLCKSGSAAATCEPGLFVDTPVRRREGHLPKKGRGCSEFHGDLCFSFFQRPTVHYAASDLFSGAEIGDRQGLARRHSGGQFEQCAMCVDHQSDGRFGKWRMLCGLSHHRDRNTKQDAIAAAMLFKLGGLRCVLFLRHSGHSCKIGLEPPKL